MNIIHIIISRHLYTYIYFNKHDTLHSPHIYVYVCSHSFKWLWKWVDLHKCWTFDRSNLPSSINQKSWIRYSTFASCSIPSISFFSLFVSRFVYFLTWSIQTILSLATKLCALFTCSISLPQTLEFAKRPSRKLRLRFAIKMILAFLYYCQNPHLRKLPRWALWEDTQKKSTTMSKWCRLDCFIGICTLYLTSYRYSIEQ